MKLIKHGIAMALAALLILLGAVVSDPFVDAGGVYDE